MIGIGIIQDSIHFLVSLVTMKIQRIAHWIFSLAILGFLWFLSGTGEETLIGFLYFN